MRHSTHINQQKVAKKWPTAEINFAMQDIKRYLVI